VINALKSDKYGHMIFSKPVDVRKLWDYYDRIKTPMDLGTVSKKLDRLEYADLEELRKDVDLIWSNALEYNGTESWLAPHVEKLKQLAEKKFTEAAAIGALHAHGLHSSQRPSGGGSVDCAMMGDNLDKLLTPDMRMQLYQNASILKPAEILELKQFVHDICPDSIREHTDVGETTIDIDSFDPPSFIRVDAHVRKLIAGRVF